MDAIWVEEYEYWFDWSTLSANTIAGTSSPYETIFPAICPIFHANFLMVNVTNEVVRMQSNG
ncbi:MAG: hypothetical protein CM15mP71_4770 [Candidatus Poseidoniales archaeon]|nr:MAG: hypothetical protein CM15mP71_4770 [Candidatus Poseidoniales archaeon]